MPIDAPIGGVTNPDNALVLEAGQDLVLLNSAGNEVMRLDAESGTIRIRNGALTTTVLIQGDSGNLRLGGAGADGDLLMFTSSAPNQDADGAVVHINSNGASVRVGMADRPGLVRVRGNGEQVDVSGDDGSVTVSGRLEVRSASGALRAALQDNGSGVIGGGGVRGRLEIRNEQSDATAVVNGELGHARLGGVGTDGRMELHDEAGTPTIVLNGETGNLGLGAAGGGNAGALFVKDGSGADSFTLNCASGEMRIGAGGNAGLLALRDDGGDETIVLNGATGNLGLGRFGTAGNVFVKNASGQNALHLSGETGNLNLEGDVRFTNLAADCAEEFDLAVPGSAEPGSVLIVGDEGRLAVCDTAYDTRAAGVVSGAGPLRPGIILGSDAGADQATRCLLAVVGRVFVRADAAHGAIGVGDLLTTSPTPGHAMRVADRSRALGAVIGKALGPLEHGRGLVEMIVSLQ